MDAAARVKVTSAEVFAVADQIAASGENPRTVQVRGRLGKGSNTTIGKLLAEWRLLRAAIVNPGAFPSEIQKSIADYLEAQIAKVRKAAEEQISEEEGARQAAEAQLDELEEQADVLRADNAALRQERDQIAGRLQQLDVDFSAERARAQDQLATSGARAHAAEREVSALTARLEAANERATAAEQRERAARGEVNAGLGKTLGVGQPRS